VLVRAFTKEQVPEWLPLTKSWFVICVRAGNATLCIDVKDTETLPNHLLSIRNDACCTPPCAVSIKDCEDRPAAVAADPDYKVTPCGIYRVKCQQKQAGNGGREHQLASHLREHRSLRRWSWLRWWACST